MTDHAGPGVYDDMDDPTYFAHPALSHSDAKLILSSPARYHWTKTTPDERPWSEAFEFGHVVHRLVLDKGPDVDVIDAENWRSKDAREQRDEAIAAGRYAILTDEYARARNCADAIAAHPIARKLLDNRTHTETVAIWDDGDVRRKAKLDAITGRFGVDVKTAVDASTDTFGRTAAKYGYGSQASWYQEALTACYGIDAPGFLFIVVEKYPPHLVNVVALDPYSVELSDRANRRAIDLYRQCRETGSWPGYGDGINQAQLPRWAEIALEAM